MLSSLDSHYGRQCLEGRKIPDTHHVLIQSTGAIVESEYAFLKELGIAIQIATTIKDHETIKDLKPFYAASGELKIPRQLANNRGYLTLLKWRGAWNNGEFQLLIKYLLFMKYLLILWATCIYSFSSAQDYILKGQLKSAESGKPVPYASVTIKNTTYGIPSNEDGIFELPLSQKFLEDSLYISSMGYKTYKEKIKNLVGKGF